MLLRTLSPGPFAWSLPSCRERRKTNFYLCVILTKWREVVYLTAYNIHFFLTSDVIYASGNFYVSIFMSNWKNVISSLLEEVSRLVGNRRVYLAVPNTSPPVNLIAIPLAESDSVFKSAYGMYNVPVAVKERTEGGRHSSWFKNTAVATWPDWKWKSICRSWKNGRGSRNCTIGKERTKKQHELNCWPLPRSYVRLTLTCENHLLLLPFFPRVDSKALSCRG